MRKKLEKGVQRLCWLYPPLEPSIKYSDVLSQRDVNVFAAFVNGHVHDVLNENPFDESTKHRLASLFFRGSTGLSKIHERDVLFIASLLSAASGRDDGLDPSSRQIVDFLRENRQYWVWLHEAYEKIVNNHAAGTCPLVVAKMPKLLHAVPFAGMLHRYQEFHKLFHESIHYVLEQQGISFDDHDLDEGLVVYLHAKVTPSVKYLHYSGDEGRRYVKNAELFNKLLDKYPRSAVIPALQHLTREDVLKVR